MAETPESATLELSDYLAAIKRRRLLLASIALPILAIALALAIGLPNIYISTGLFTFTDATVPGEMPANANADAIQRLQEQYRDAYVDSLSSSVMSDASYKQLIQAVPDVVSPGTDMDTAVKRVSRRARVETVRTPVLDPNTGRNLDIISAFTVSYEDRRPDVAARAAGWLTNAFLMANRHGRLVSAKAAEQFYDTQTQTYRQQIADIESKLATFKSKNYDQLPGLTNLNMNIMQTTQQQIDSLTQQIAALRQNHVFLQQQLDAAKNAGEDEGLLAQLQAEYNKKLATYDPDYPDMIALRQQIDALKEGGGAVNSLSLPAQLRAEEQALAQAKLRYSEDFPDVKRLERQIQILKTRIAHGEKYAGNAVGSPAVVTLKTELNANETQTAALERQVAGMRQQLMQLEGHVEAAPQVERQYKALALNLQLAQTKYNQLLKYQMDAQLTSQAIASGRSDRIRVVQQPSVPLAPGKPKRVAIAAVGLMLAILLGLTAVVIAESVDQNVRGSRDIRRVLAVSPLGVIPEIQDSATARRYRLQVATLTACVFVGTAVVLMTARSFYS
ncbi:MAG TPA: GNVR domain-containing protein [Steroidobacteraceae bacterium]|nr:GNVR domain-containing protein [Steroidobacteraceae bacterium]